MKILLISALDVWALAGQGGAPSLFRTLDSYGRHGHDIDFICPTVGANHHDGRPAGPLPMVPGVNFHPFRLPSLRDGLSLPSRAATVDQKLRFALLFSVLASR